MAKANQVSRGPIKAKGLALSDNGAAVATRVPKVARVALGTGTSGGGVFAWQNPEAGAIAVTRVLLDVTTAATAAATVDVGTTATSATTSSDTLIDGLDVNAAAGLFSNLKNPGTNGKADQRLASGKWVTASQASGAVAGLVGYAYIEYVVL